MRFDTVQHLRLSQSMKLAPRMIQNMEILQMPLAQLEERIEQELQSNPTLELVELEPESATAMREEQIEQERDERELERPMSVGGEGGDEFARLERFESENLDQSVNGYESEGIDEWRAREPMSRSDVLPGERPTGGGSDGEWFDAVEAAPSRGASLGEQLREQWRLADADPDLRRAGELIIAHLDEDGFLRESLSAIVERQPRASAGANGDGSARLLTEDDLLFALEALQETVDPPGIAARDVRECLLLQLRALRRDKGLADDEPDDAIDTAVWLVEEHFEDLTHRRFPAIARATSLTLQEITAATELLQRLSLAPGRRLIDERAASVVPDAIVEYDEEHDRYFAYLNDRRLPNLQINREYARLARESQTPARDKEFLRKNLSNAQWLIDAVRQRHETLLRVLNVVVERQRDVFEQGPQSLRPLPMTEVAERLGVHVATVSRAVSEKSILTPRGVMPLRSFFSGGYQTEGGEEVSYDAVRASVKEVVDGEDKSNPLSDEAIVKQLKERGVEIARRTVAKYRDQLSIPPARLRRAY